MLMDALRSAAAQRCAQARPTRFDAIRQSPPPGRDRRAGTARSLPNQTRMQSSRSSVTAPASACPAFAAPDAGTAAVSLVDRARASAASRRCAIGTDRIGREVGQPLFRYRAGSPVSCLAAPDANRSPVRARSRSTEFDRSPYQPGARGGVLPVDPVLMGGGGGGSDPFRDLRPLADRPPRSPPAPRPQTASATARPGAPDHRPAKENRLFCDRTIRRQTAARKPSAAAIRLPPHRSSATISVRPACRADPPGPHRGDRPPGQRMRPPGIHQRPPA